MSIRLCIHTKVEGQGGGEKKEREPRMAARKLFFASHKTCSLCELCERDLLKGAERSEE